MSPAKGTLAAEHISTRQAIVPLVVANGGEPTTTSTVVADRFHKRHDTILRAIRNLQCSDEFGRRNFAEISITDSCGREQPAYRITKDGFMFLAMGFSGRDAAALKELFISAFNRQVREIERLRRLQGDPEWRQARVEGVVARRGETDTIRQFVEYAKSQGSRSASRYYVCLTRETNRALFFVQGACGPGFRDRLTLQQLATLAMAEKIVERALLQGMSDRVYYKDIFRLAADRVRAFAQLIGRSAPGLTSLPEVAQ